MDAVKTGNQAAIADYLCTHNSKKLKKWASLTDDEKTNKKFKKFYPERYNCLQLIYLSNPSKGNVFRSCLQKCFIKAELVSKKQFDDNSVLNEFVCQPPIKKDIFSFDHDILHNLLSSFKNSKYEKFEQFIVALIFNKDNYNIVLDLADNRCESVTTKGSHIFESIINHQKVDQDIYNISEYNNPQWCVEKKEIMVWIVSCINEAIASCNLNLQI